MNAKVSDQELFKLSQGELYAWVEQGASVMLKSVTKHGDPVELNEVEVRMLCEALQKMLREIE